MAELQVEFDSSVKGGFSEMNESQEFDVNSSSLTVEKCGSRKSEVNNDQSLGIMPVSNVSNNFQSSDISAISTSTEVCSKVCIPEREESTKNETDRHNLKNKQLAHEDNSTIKDQDENSKTSASPHNKVQSNGSNLTEESNHKEGKKRRGIRFPKDTFISSYFEPPDPWKNAPSWTTDDLIVAYRKSCELHGTKPVVKVLQQLHTVSTPGKREESFILRGEKLDHKQVECIEEILRRVQFQLVDLEDSHLDDECAVALFDMIEYYESACQLNISSNRNIGARGWQACSRLVRRTPTLRYLDMRNCDLNERTIPIFGRALKMGCHLTILHMENMMLSGRPLIILVAALKMNETLQELFLAENKLMPTDGIQLGNLMRYNHKLNLLDLRKNLLQDVGVTHICDGLMEQSMGYGLRTMVLWNNQISYQAMPSLGRVLAASQSLETLNIGHNNITNEGIHLLKDGLLKTNSLLRIGLQGTGISDEGGVALAEFIADSTMLLRIDLRDNEIKTGGLMALSHAMRVNSSVTRIDIDRDTKKESGIKDYAEQQSRLLRDILTFQQRNIQTATEREEEERARLEKLALEAAAAKERKETETEQEGPLDSSTALGTASEEEEVPNEDEQVGQQDVSDLPRDDQADEEEEAVSSPDDSSTIPSANEEEQHTSALQRPTVLFSRKDLQPQESLDSPQLTHSDFKVHSQNAQSEEATPTKPVFQSLSASGEKFLCTSTPAEMLLSPQYYPKQLARKIFSVTHVNEDFSSTSASPSLDKCHSDVDPLNVSSLQQSSSSTMEPLSASPKSIPSNLTPSSSSSLTDSASVHFSAAISPTMLVRDLANETVKQIVTIDELGSSDDSVTELQQTCLSSESPAPSSISLSPLDSSDICVASGANEISCGYEMPSCQADEMLLPVETTCDSLKDCDEKSETLQSSSFSSQNDLKSCEESSHSEMSGENTNSVMNIEETQSVVSSMINREKSEELQNKNLSMSNTSVSVTSEKSCIANSNIEDQTPISSSANDSQTVSDTLSSTSGACPTGNDCNLTESASRRSSSSDGNKGAPTETIMKSESQSSFSEVESVQDIDNVDISLEEEPWTAVDGDESKAENAKQPDFFTTLSMNGLTQELASALTPLDGSSHEEDTATDLKPHDEFERELDAMLADVKSKPLFK